MIYAIVENGVVTNLVIGPLPDAIPGIAVGECPVAIGDFCDDGTFYRNGVAVCSEVIDSI
ncbi:MAG: hypothetical protein VB062_04220 [Christensenella sp.]|nr:hypothetical protein [Christensenella sp.]